MKVDDKLLNKKWKLLRYEKASQIYKHLFSDWLTVTEISKRIYKHLYQKGSKKRYKKRPNPVVSLYVKAFLILGWLEFKRDEYDGRKTRYKATLVPYYEYLESKAIFLTRIEEKYLSSHLQQYDDGIVHETEPVLDVLNRLSKQIIYSQFIGFINLDKVPLRIDSKFPIAVRLALKFYDRFTLRLLVEFLKTKCQVEAKQVKSGKQDKRIADWVYKIEEELSGK